jgi:hypothetical protein
VASGCSPRQLSSWPSLAKGGWPLRSPLHVLPVRLGKGRPWSLVHPSDMQERLEAALTSYACLKPHQGLGGAVPAEIYFGIRPAHLDARRPPREQSLKATDQAFEVAFLDPEGSRTPTTRSDPTATRPREALTTPIGLLQPSSPTGARRAKADHAPAPAPGPGEARTPRRVARPAVTRLGYRSALRAKTGTSGASSCHWSSAC